MRWKRWRIVSDVNRLVSSNVPRRVHTDARRHMHATHKEKKMKNTVAEGCGVVGWLREQRIYQT